MADWLTDWLTEWLAVWLTSWLTDWLTDWLTGWLTDWLTHSLTDWLTDWLTNWLTDWVIDWLSDRHIDWLTVWRTDWLTDTDWLADWLTDWLTDLLKLFCETSFKNEALKIKNEAVLRDFFQKWSFEDQKRSISARLSSKMKLWSSKTKHFCETSFKNDMLTARLTSDLQYVLAIFKWMLQK